MINFKNYTLAELPELTANWFGARPALSMVGGHTYSYRDFERLTRNVAEALIAAGIQKGDRVALLAESSPLWVISWFGSARAGAVVVPILNDFTAEQIENIIAHSGARIVLVSEKLRTKLANLGTAEDAGVSVWNICGILQSVTHPVQLPDVQADDLAMIVYTSGTTGLSKGVMLTHRNIVANALATKSIISVHPKDRLLSILPLAHTYEFTIGLVVPLSSGAHISYLDKPPTASALLPAFKVVRPTIMLSVPLVIEKIYQSGVAPSLSRHETL